MMDDVYKQLVQPADGIAVQQRVLSPAPFFIAEILIGVLAVVFGIRFAKGKKFMPSGLMVSVSVIVLVALLLLH